MNLDAQHLQAYRDAAAADMGPTSADDELDPEADWQTRLREEMGVEDGFDEDLSDQYARFVWGFCCLWQHAGKPPICMLNGCCLPASLLKCICWLLR